jgi:Aldehyde dehydrogenase family
MVDTSQVCDSCPFCDSVLSHVLPSAFAWTGNIEVPEGRERPCPTEVGGAPIGLLRAPQGRREHRPKGNPRLDLTRRPLRPPGRPPHPSAPEQPTDLNFRLEGEGDGLEQLAVGEDLIVCDPDSGWCPSSGTRRRSRSSGGIPERTALLAQKWDLIFFTGSPSVGKIIHKAAAENLTPAVHELGGKNPTIVHSSADLKPAARRIAYGRFVNSGHICTAPDHVLVWPEAEDELVAHLKEAIRDFYGDDPKQSPDYGRVINKRNFDRLAAFIGSGTIAAGGETDPDELYIAPTVLVDVPVDSPIMEAVVLAHTASSARSWRSSSRRAPDSFRDQETESRDDE